MPTKKKIDNFKAKDRNLRNFPVRLNLFLIKTDSLSDSLLSEVVLVLLE